MFITITPHEDNPHQKEDLGLAKVLKVETTIESDDGQQYKIFLLDADDTFDVVVHYPNSQREIVWSLARERAG